MPAFSDETKEQTWRREIKLGRRVETKTRGLFFIPINNDLAELLTAVCGAPTLCPPGEKKEKEKTPRVDQRIAQKPQAGGAHGAQANDQFVHAPSATAPPLLPRPHPRPPFPPPLPSSPSSFSCPPCVWSLTVIFRNCSAVCSTRSSSCSLALTILSLRPPFSPDEEAEGCCCGSSMPIPSMAFRRSRKLRALSRR